MTNFDIKEPRNVDDVEDMIIALRENDKDFRTDYLSERGAEMDIQFKADSSYGLSKKRYGWYSNRNLFDSTFFSELDGLIRMETSATSGDTAQLRSAYPGIYYPHSPADASVGIRIPSEYIEYDSDGLASLTHGEITAGVIEVDPEQDIGINTAAFSFESDGVYAQVRASGEDTHFVRQDNWNVDRMDGSGPTGEQLEPDDGLIYNVTYSWYGFGNFYFQVYSKETGRMETVHIARTEGSPSINTPNLPIHIAVENKNNAQPLGVDVGGMAFVTHGTNNVDVAEEARTLETTRITNSSYIDTTAVTNNNSLDPFAEPGVPLISTRRDETDLESRVTMNLEIINAFIECDADVYIYIWDEYNGDNSLTNSNFRVADTSDPSETRALVDTEATDYTPSSDANLRGVTYIGTTNKSTETQTGDSNARVPLEATMVMTAVLAPGANATDANPALIEVREDW